jgi:hypothetical protein
MSSPDEKSQKLGEMLVQIRNAFQGATEAIDAYISFLGKPLEPASLVKEETFTILKFEKQQGAKIGEYEVAYKPNNLPDKWIQAYNIPRQNNATINNRYYGESYVHNYWLYGEDKIYRQKLKPKA